MPERKRTSGRRAVALSIGLVAGLVDGASTAMAQPAPTERIVVRLDVGVRPGSRTFATNTVFNLFSEPGGFQTDYEFDRGGIVDGGISFRLWRNLAVGLDLESYRSVHVAQITADLPHPIFFDLPRTTTGVADGLERRELWVHLRALWVMQLTDWLVVSVSGGPSLLNARQDLVSSVEHMEVGFPFDEIIFSGHTVKSRSGWTVGLNEGVEIYTFVLHKLPFLSRYEMMEQVGLGLLVRNVWGSVDLRVGDDLIAVDHGGVEVTTGLRLRF